MVYTRIGSPTFWVTTRFLHSGGFIYFRIVSGEKTKVVAVNAIVPSGARTHAIAFGKPHALKPALAAQLSAQRRWNQVADPAYARHGATSSAFLMPSEGGFGAFAYRFSPESKMPNRVFPVVSAA